MPGPVIRSATQADAAAIRALIHSILAEYGLSADPVGMDADLVNPAAYYAQRSGSFDLIVDQNGAVAGTVALLPLDCDTVELRKMYFHPAIRGRGWGRLLLERMMATARAQGHRRMVLLTASAMTEAIRLYRACGFRQREGVPGVSRCDRAFERDLVYPTTHHDPDTADRALH